MASCMHADLMGPAHDICGQCNISLSCDADPLRQLMQDCKPTVPLFSYPHVLEVCLGMYIVIQDSGAMRPESKESNSPLQLLIGFHQPFHNPVSVLMYGLVLSCTSRVLGGCHPVQLHEAFSSLARISPMCPSLLPRSAKSACS